MSRKTTKKPPKSGRVEWIGFASVGMPVGLDYGTVQDALPHDDAYQVIQDLTITGHKVSFSFDDRVDGFRCSITGNRPDSPNAGVTLTAIGGTVERAIFAAGYKHYVLCGGGEWPTKARNQVDL